MSFNNEKPPEGGKAIIFLVIAFFLIFAPLQLGDRELYWSEGDYSAMTMEMDFALPLTIAHGELIPATFPMFPWISALLCRYLGFTMEFSLRIISVLSLAALTILAWDAGRRALNIQAGAVAAAVMLSSIIIIEKTLDGYPNTLALLFIFMGWLVWFTFGAARGSWNRAWIYSMFCCGLAFYTLGWPCLIYFAFPLLFMRRPLTLWTKLQRPGFFVGLAILFVFIFLWGFSRWSAGTDIPFSSLPIDKGVFEDYFQHLLTFPFEIILRFLPWSIIAWTPFCVAYHPLDKNPIFSRYLRTIFISLFFLLWISPFTKSRDLIILAPTLAVMTGINYWLLVRRHGHQIHKLLKIFSYAAILGGFFIIAFYLVPVEWWQDFYPSSFDIAFRYNSKNILFGIIQGSICVICGILMNIHPQERRCMGIHPAFGHRCRPFSLGAPQSLQGTGQFQT